MKLDDVAKLQDRKIQDTEKFQKPNLNINERFRRLDERGGQVGIAAVGSTDTAAGNAEARKWGVAWVGFGGSMRRVASEESADMSAHSKTLARGRCAAEARKVRTNQIAATLAARGDFGNWLAGNGLEKWGKDNRRYAPEKSLLCEGDRRFSVRGPGKRRKGQQGQTRGEARAGKRVHWADWLQPVGGHIAASGLSDAGGPRNWGCGTAWSGEGLVLR